MSESKRNFTEDQRICDAATGGKWRRQTNGPGVVTENGEQSRIIVEDSATLTEDARFIAEARTGWPAALAEIERLTFERDIAVEGFREQADLAGELIEKNTQLRKYAGFLRSVIRCGQSLPDYYDINSFMAEVSADGEETTEEEYGVGPEGAD